jgi:hypothetical protein
LVSGVVFHLKTYNLIPNSTNASSKEFPRVYSKGVRENSQEAE